MRLCSFRAADRTLAGVVIGKWIVAVEEINKRLGTMFAPTLTGLIAWGQSAALQEKVQQAALADCERLAVSSTPVCIPYPHPPRIWDSRLSARAPTGDAPLPTELARVWKPATTIIGPGETILLPPQSEGSIGTAALGVIISCSSPGTVVIWPGDRVGCAISGIGHLENPVAALERKS